MERREFLKITSGTVAGLVAMGYLPLLGADKKKTTKNMDTSVVSHNIYTEPPAIEPITGYLPRFQPAAGGAMAGAFNASYSLIQCWGSDKKSKVLTSGTIDVICKKGACMTTETRKNKPKINVLKTSIKCAGGLNTASKWTMVSTIEGRKDLEFTEEGSWDGNTMTVKSSSWTQKKKTSNPLIGRWSLLPIIASGIIKKKSLKFDMLDDSTLRSDQTLRYEGEIEIPVKGGKATMNSYVQTGHGIVPTHYLVDSKGRVQLITMTTVNWALTS